MKNYKERKPWSRNQIMRLAFLGALTILIIACNKEDNDPVDRLPKATETGENTFACFINGGEWAANEGLSGTTNDILLKYDESGTYIWGNHYFSMSAQRLTSFVQLEIFRIRIEPVIKEGQLNVDDLNILTIEYSIDSNVVESDLRSYELDRSFPTKFELSNIDTINNICSGVFEFQLQNLEDSLDVILITDGRFDVPYTTY